MNNKKETNKQNELPQTLAHYTDLKGLDGILSTGEIFATHFRYLNDISELDHLYEIFPSLTKQWLANTNSTERQGTIIKLVQSTLPDQKENSVFVASFATESDDLTLWRGYCPNGGVALAFEPWKLEEAANDHGFNLLKCCYDSKEHVELVSHSFWSSNFFLDHIPVRVNLLQASGHILSDLLRLRPLLKHPKFVDEREWRLVSQPFERKLVIQKRNGDSVPYVRVPIAIGKRLPLKQITLHPQYDSWERVVKAILIKRGYSHIEVVKSEIPIRNNSLDGPISWIQEMQCHFAHNISTDAI